MDRLALFNHGEQVGGRYTILEEIGRGGNGVVYSALDEQMQIQVAVKAFRARTNRQRIFLLKEARILKKLQHPHILRFYGLGLTDSGIVYLVTELLHGYPIFRLVPKNQGLSFFAAYPYLVQICDAMAYAHDEGIVHLDLKPSNILAVMDPKHHQQIKILDFSIAKETRYAVSAERPVGTPGYASPEQIRGEKCDERSDIYSMGAVLAFLLTGQRPYHGQNKNEIIHKQLSEPPSVLEHSHIVELAALAPMILKAMSLNPDQRYQHVRDLHAALVQLGTST